MNHILVSHLYLAFICVMGIVTGKFLRRSRRRTLRPWRPREVE